MKKMETGFTLIEIVVMLAIVSIGVAFYAQQQSHADKVDQARSVGQQLFQYHNALKAYALRASVDPSSISTGSHTGVKWLKDTGCGGTADQAYLPCSFQENFPFGGLNYKANVSTSNNSNGDTIITINSETSPYISKDGLARPDLAGLAAITASGNSSILTPISQSLGDLSSNPKTATISMTASNTPLSSDVWLRTDGTTPMDASITFSNTNNEDRNLTNVSKILPKNSRNLIFGDASLSGNLVVDYDTSIYGSLLVQNDLETHGDISVAGLIHSKGDIHTKSNISSDSSFISDGSISIAKSADMDGNITSGQNTSSGQNTNIDGALDVSANMSAGKGISTRGELHVSGDISTQSYFAAKGEITALDNMRAANSATVKGTVESGLDIIGAKGIVISSDSILDDNLAVSGLATIGGNTSVGNNVFVNGNLHAKRDAEFNQDVKVDGKSTFNTLSGDLQVAPRGTVGRGCSPNGRIATDSVGELLSCANGKWKKMGDFIVSQTKSGVLAPSRKSCKTSRIADKSYAICSLTGTGGLGRWEHARIYKNSNGDYYMRGCRGDWRGRWWWQCFK
ncbi:type II secretion system protein [Neptuniibacter sp. QD37_11]|uniref:type II secretion system protein n=1 Tax=Neptuniibacter sp. QD37_11 TaxID=3398209 RepID=UPI0039F618A7